MCIILGKSAILGTPVPCLPFKEESLMGMKQ
jgi:hypothetical protein